MDALWRDKLINNYTNSRKDSLVSVEYELRLLQHLPDPEAAITGAGCDWPLTLQAVYGRHPILMTKPGNNKICGTCL